MFQHFLPHRYRLCRGTDNHPPPHMLAPYLSLYNAETNNDRAVIL
ncbi:hypothetical protein BN1221_02588c [Brenneria goodwinii]|uniref:Uncharacterized protein n=1 Tax=Brenneria goodwinii TaxID=1109412 RepID=A0A0G4JWS4_9GAMM|nr:hypothetical protein BN1221_02588c [Brenneria goodwinii]